MAITISKKREVLRDTLKPLKKSSSTVDLEIPVSRRKPSTYPINVQPLKPGSVIYEGKFDNPYISPALIRIRSRSKLI